MSVEVETGCPGPASRRHSRAPGGKNHSGGVQNETYWLDDELSARVRALVRRAYHIQNPCLEVGELRIETATERVWRGSEQLRLTPREYALLEYLAMRSGEVVSRTEIWEHVYDFKSEADSNVVDVYIGYLRKKIERPGKPSMIRTLRGRGYSLGDER